MPHVQQPEVTWNFHSALSRDATAMDQVKATTTAALGSRASLWSGGQEERQGAWTQSWPQGEGQVTSKNSL